MSVARNPSRVADKKQGNRKAAPSRSRSAGNQFDLEECEPRWLLSASGVIVPNLEIIPDRAAVAVQGYTPAQIKEAYSFPGLRATGAGQTIAIVDAYSDPNITADLAVFDKEFGLAAPPSFSIVSQTGGSTRSIAEDAGWAGEIALDVEWAHAMAPGANIVLVEANSDSEQNLMAAANYARTIRGVSVVSMSWGENETLSQTSYDSIFTTPSGHTGVTFVAASGDDGAAAGPEYPASSPNVLAVGGTTLNLNSNGTISSETAWSDSSGGQSIIETATSYQSSVTGYSARTTPDVAYDADPNTGVAVYDSVAYEGIVGWQEVGGTSAGTPQWAGIIALANQVRAADRLAPLNGQTQTLPAIYSLYAVPGTAGYTTYTSYFNDITSGSSGGGGFGGFTGSDVAADVSPSRRGGFGGGGFGTVSAAAGYDTLTGLGTPRINAIVGALVAWGTESVSVVRTGRAAAAAESAAVERQELAAHATVDDSSAMLSDAALAASARPPSGSAVFARQAVADDTGEVDFLGGSQGTDGGMLSSIAPAAVLSATVFSSAPAPRVAWAAEMAAPAAPLTGVVLAHSPGVSFSDTPIGSMATFGGAIHIECAAVVPMAHWATTGADAAAVYQLSAGLVMPSWMLESASERLTSIRWFSAIAATAAVAGAGFVGGFLQKRRRIAQVKVEAASRRF